MMDQGGVGSSRYTHTTGNGHHRLDDGDHKRG